MSRRKQPAADAAELDALGSIAVELLDGEPSKVTRYGLITGETDDDGVRWMRTQSGGSADRFGDQYLALSLAVHAIGDALTMCAPRDTILGRVALVLPHDVFVRLRDAISDEDKGGGVMFKGPRRKTVDHNRLVTMLGGIVIASELAEGYGLPERIVRCPGRRATR